MAAGRRLTLWTAFIEDLFLAEFFDPFIEPVDDQISTDEDALDFLIRKTIPDNPMHHSGI